MDMRVYKIPGNGCGHMRRVARVYNRPEGSRRPAILEYCIERTKELYKNPKLFNKKVATYHINDHKVRSERREAISLVCQTIFHYLDLGTLNVGFYTKDEFKSFDLKKISKIAGINVSRAKRAILHLAKHGYITLKRQCYRNKDGKIRGRTSIRNVSTRLLLELGADPHKLSMAIKWKKEKREKSLRKIALKTLKDAICLVNSSPNKTFNNSQPSKKKYDDEPIKNQSLVTKALELHLNNPAKSCSEYLLELRLAS